MDNVCGCERMWKARNVDVLKCEKKADVEYVD